MGEFKAVPLDMINAPNTFAPLTGNIWTIINPNAQTLWFQLQISDSLGDRRYIPAVGATLTATFRRMDIISSINGSINQTNRDVVKTITFNASDKSLCQIAMTPTDITNIVSGGILFTLTESGQVTRWVQDWIVSKKLIELGF